MLEHAGKRIVKAVGGALPAACIGAVGVVYALGGSTAQAWTSVKGMWSDAVHQTAINNVPEPGVSPSDRLVLAKQQAIIDKDQEPSQSAEHAMTGILNSKQDVAQERKTYIDLTERLLKASFTSAIDSRRNGDASRALPALAKAIHVLEDATSPAHRTFQVWSADFGIWEMAAHVYKERVYPSDATHLEGTVRYAYDIYLEKKPLPPRFFDDEGCLLNIDPNCGPN